MGKAIFHTQNKIKIDLAEGDSVFGRKTSDTYVIKDDQVSSKHFRISVFGEVSCIEDLGSKNGTYVNNKKIEAKTVLSNHDEITAGSHHFVFLNDTDSEQEFTESNRDPLLAPMAKDQKIMTPVILERDEDAALAHSMQIKNELSIDLQIKRFENEIEILRKKRQLLLDKEQKKRELLSHRKEIFDRVGREFDNLIIKNALQEKSILDEVLKLRERADYLERQVAIYKEKCLFEANEDQLFEHTNKDYPTEIAEVDEKITVCYKKMDFLRRKEEAMTLNEKAELEKQMKAIQDKINAMSGSKKS